MKIELRNLLLRKRKEIRREASERRMEKDEANEREQRIDDSEGR